MKQYNEYEMDKLARNPFTKLFGETLQRQYAQANPSPWANMPQAPGYVGMHDPSVNEEMKHYIHAMEGLKFDPDTSGLEALKSDALRTGASPWASLMNRQQGLQSQMGASRLGSEAARSGAQAAEGMAMRGGLSGGAAERLGNQSTYGMLQGRGALEGQRMSNMMGVGAQDEENRRATLAQLPGQQMDLAKSRFEAERGRIGDLYKGMMGAADRQSQFKQDQYNTGMSAWASNQLADRMKGYYKK